MERVESTVRGRIIRGEGRTLDRDMGLDENRTKTIVPVMTFDAVPNWAVGVRIRSRWALRRQLGMGKETSVPRCLISHGSVPVTGELANFELHVVHGGFYAWAPFIEHLGRAFEVGEAFIGAAVRIVRSLHPLGIAVVDQLHKFVGDALLNFIE